MFITSEFNPMKHQASGVEPPVILAECRDEVLPVCLRRALFGLLADEGRIVTDVVIAGKIAAVDGQRVVQSFCEIEIVRMIRDRRTQRRRC